MARSTQNSPQSGLTAHNLTCQRGERLVFEGLSFAVAHGEALVLRGRNGSGKSSLLRLLAGLLAPASGTLSWDGEDVTADPVSHAARLAYVGHLDPIKAALTVSENLQALGRLAGQKPDIDAALEAFGLLPLKDLPAQFLSAGQRRRVNLARLLAAPKTLWLLDEPTVALDKVAVQQLLKALQSHLAGGGMAIIATHDDLPLAGARTLELSG
ncbi:MAG: heme ABC exporter ATP-binding protein CcmA [Alphaproteobacteria bacterium]